MKQENIYDSKFLKLRNLTYLFLICGLGISNPIVKANQIANSSIDLKKDIDNVKQKSFKDKDNLDATVDELIDNEGITFI